MYYTPALPNLQFPTFTPKAPRFLDGSARPSFLPPLSMTTQFLFPKPRSSGILASKSLEVHSAAQLPGLNPSLKGCCSPSSPQTSIPQLPESSPALRHLLLYFPGQPGQLPGFPGLQTQSDILPEHSMGACMCPNPASQAAFHPNCLESLGLSFPWKPNPPRSQQAWRVSSWPRSYPSFPLSRDFQTHLWGWGRGPPALQGRGLEGGNCRQGWGSARGSRIEEGRPAPQGGEVTG